MYSPVDLLSPAASLERCLLGRQRLEDQKCHVVSYLPLHFLETNCTGVARLVPALCSAFSKSCRQGMEMKQDWREGLQARCFTGTVSYDQTQMWRIRKRS